MTRSTTNPTHDLDEDLAIVSQELENELFRAERELQLEHSHLKALVDLENKELADQIDAMGKSISRLYTSLEKTRMYLQLAQGESYVLRQEMQSRVTSGPPLVA